MSVVYIRARIACDECDTRFEVEMDPAYLPPADWSLWDVVENAVRSGVAVANSLKLSSVQDGRMLCETCTNEADRAAIEAAS